MSCRKEKLLWNSTSSEKAPAMKVRSYLLWKTGCPEELGNAEYCFSEKLAFSKK